MKYHILQLPITDFRAPSIQRTVSLRLIICESGNIRFLEGLFPELSGIPDQGSPRARVPVGGTVGQGQECVAGGAASRVASMAWWLVHA